MIGSLNSPGTTSHFRKSWAVLIGVNEYKEPIPSLRFAEADAVAIAELLPSLGFVAANVKLLLGRKVTREALREVIDEIGSEMEEEDRIIVFFAGHGVPVSNVLRDTGFFLLPDSKINGAMPTRFEPKLKYPPSDALSMNEFLEMLYPLPAMHKLLLLDCCYSGFLKTARRFAVGGAADEKFIEKYKAPVIQVLTAGRDDEVASEDPGLGHGYFTKALLDGLRGKAFKSAEHSLTTFTELAAYVSLTVKEQTRADQNPRFGEIQGKGEFFFLRCPAAPVEVKKPELDENSPISPRPKTQRISAKKMKLAQLLERACEAESQKDFETAIAALTEAQAIDPSFEERLNVLREQLEATKSKRENGSELKKEIAELLEYGQLAESQGDFQEAVLAIEKVQKLDPLPVKIEDRLGELRAKAASDPKVRSKELWKQSEQAAARGDWDEAIVALEEATKLNAGYGTRLARLKKDRDAAKKVTPSDKSLKEAGKQPSVAVPMPSNLVAPDKQQNLADRGWPQPYISLRQPKVKTTIYGKLNPGLREVLERLYVLSIILPPVVIPVLAFKFFGWPVGLAASLIAIYICKMIDDDVTGWVITLTLVLIPTLAFVFGGWPVGLVASLIFLYGFKKASD